MRALILGANGAVGRSVVKHLLANRGKTSANGSSLEHNSITTVGRTQVNDYNDLGDGEDAGTSIKQLTLTTNDLKRLTTKYSPLSSQANTPPLAIQRQLEHLAAKQGGRFDAVFCTLGTRFPPVIDERRLREVDGYLVQQLAAICKHQLDIPYFALLSFYGASPQSKQSIQRVKGETEEFIKQLRFDRTTFFRPAWFYRPPPTRESFDCIDASLVGTRSTYSYYQAMFDYYANTYCRFVFPFMYLPTKWLPRQMWTAEVDDVGKAMIRDAQRFLSGEDEQEMQQRIGWRGLKRLCYDDFLKLSKDYDEAHHAVNSRS